MWPYTEGETLRLVRGIAEEAFGATERSAPRFLAQGSNNEAFLIEVDGQKVVIRVTGDWRERQTHRERWCYAQARRLGIPSPRTLALGKREKLPYLALAYVEGEIGTVAKVDVRELWRTLGRYAALVNSVEIGEASLVVEGTLLYEAPAKEWREGIEACLPSHPDDGLSDEEREKVQRVLLKMRDREFRFGLSHGDLDPRNLIVAPNGVAFLIDWCCSRVGPVPHVDLYNILREIEPASAAMEAYLEGYGLAREAFEAILPEVRAYGLLENLKDLSWARAERPDLVSEKTEALRRTIDVHLRTMDEWATVA